MFKEIDFNYHKVQGNIMTPWGEKLRADNVLPEYPRPQMVRDKWMNLNGLWDYAITAMDQESPKSYDGSILVPFAIESALSGVKKPLLPTERLWYRRSFKLPESFKEDRILLHFGAVDWKAEVWINGIQVGEHTGGYYPFSFEITEYLKVGDNEIVVGVWDPTDSYGQERGKQSLKPKSIFYTPVSGIWQTVWLEAVPKSYIKSFKITPDIDREQVTLEINAESPSGAMIEVSIYEEGIKVSSARKGLGQALSIGVKSPRLWSPASPFLYDLSISLVINNEIVDKVKSYFAMRKFSVDKDEQGFARLFLNNEPLFQNGVLDQGYWPDGLYTAPSDEALRFDVEITKRLGFNMTRKHIKVEPARWYYHCDRLGLIVWQDMINGGGPTKTIYHMAITNFLRMTTLKDSNYRRHGRQLQENRDNYMKELKEMVDALYNVPSIGLWVPFNEAWGQFDGEKVYKWLKSYDATRPIDHASGWQDQGSGDLKSEHIYFKKLFLPKDRKGRVLAITEYGGYSLAEQGHLWQTDKAFGYKGYQSKEELTKAYVDLINKQLKPLISRGLSAAVYTQLTDVETEINGFVTYDRRVIKMDEKQVAEANNIADIVL